ncbi:MAG: hypothetical protein VXZ40_02065 [Nanoarchaeota archaeon]|nr:hypothetical protein [Nanoarchaeota archaeon]
MLFYITAVGSGNSLNYPHNKNYEGVLAIAERTKERGFTYKNQNQKELFESKYHLTQYKYKELLVIDTHLDIYNTGVLILNEIDNIKKKYPRAKFHIELSAGYKRMGHVLTLISYIRSQDIEKLTFLRHTANQEYLPIITIELTDREKDILHGFKHGAYFGWNGKINTNSFVRNYQKDRKYVYRILKKCKQKGLLDDQNRITDFGELFLEFS